MTERDAAIEAAASNMYCDYYGSPPSGWKRACRGEKAMWLRKASAAIAAYEQERAKDGAVAYIVRNPMVQQAPVRAKGKYPDIGIWVYPVHRKDDAEALATMMRADCDPLYLRPSPAADVKALREALKQAQRALLPLRNAVFNDNGDMTVSGPYPYEEAIAGYYAYGRIERALATLGGGE